MKRSFFYSVCILAIPVALQSMLQSSFSIVDQIMIGQLGSTNVCAVGLAGKFSSIFTVIISAIGAVAGIMISQYIGQKNSMEVKKSFYLNQFIFFLLAFLFLFASLFFSEKIIQFYIQDTETIQQASLYLKIFSFSFIPYAFATLFSSYLRCIEKAQIPLYITLFSALCNTILNYFLIFGKGIFPSMGIKGAAIASVLSQWLNCILLFLFVYNHTYLKDKVSTWKFPFQQYITILFPILACEFLWSVGENVYASIYGHLSIESSAAMTLTNPIQGLLIGALCGLSSAASIIISKLLGQKEYEDAYQSSVKILKYGLFASVGLSIIVLFTRSIYVQIYQVDTLTKQLTTQILLAYALVAPFKVENMILGSGILRSGGKTKYVMYIDIIGTYGFGIPLGYIAAFVFKLSIPYVYFILSLEECVRFLLSMIVFKKRKWIHTLK